MKFMVVKNKNTENTTEKQIEKNMYERAVQ